MSTRRILITGANGYIAAQTVSHFLSHGWTVRGTVRSLKSPSTVSLSSHFSAEISSGRLELVPIPDIKSPSAFHDALRDCTAVAHLASPVVFDSGDVNYIMDTAVQGTLSVLEAAASHGKDVKSFVLMSSIVAVGTGGTRPGPYSFTEKDWNDAAVDQLREQGDKAFGHLIYVASKVASERAFWKWIEGNKPAFVGTSLCPSWVAGPPAFPPSSPDGIAETNKFIYTILSGGQIPAGPGPGYGTHVDVRDVARMVEWAASHPEVAGGQRYLVGGNGNAAVPQAAADILREAYPERREIIPLGEPGKGYLPGLKPDPKAAVPDSTKAIEATGQEWIPYEKIVLDAAKMFEVFL
ncbi:NAD(P)-binding protein [Xylariaceae sp. FL1019]|nr:NAD(P)-binding protein [Xylariaceae sp. FL1019]